MLMTLTVGVNSVKTDFYNEFYRFHKMLQHFWRKPGANFINILHANFSFESSFKSKAEKSYSKENGLVKC